MEKPNITFLDYAQLVNLVPGEGGFWAQLLVQDEPRVLSCSYCILCTGGIGRVYPYTTNSAIATGDGITLAHEMGARIRNLHLVQFHPTALRRPPRDGSGSSSRRRSGGGGNPAQQGRRTVYVPLR